MRFDLKPLKLRWLLIWAGCFALALGSVLLLGAGLHAALAPEDREIARRLFNSTGDLAFLLIIVLFAATGLLAAWITRTYFAPLLRAAGETRLINATNPGARLDTVAPREARAVAEAVNALAALFQGTVNEDGKRIDEARADLERERHRLAALMSELAQGVVVCNAEGRILLYNERARRLLTKSDADGANTGSGGYMGLGRSLYSLMHKDSIEHALDRLRARVTAGTDDPITSFTTSIASGAVVRARIAPVAGTVTAGRSRVADVGFVLLLEDLSRDLSELEHRDALLIEVVEQSRSALASLRAATENLACQADLPVNTRSQFLHIAQHELLRLGDLVEHAGRDHAERMNRRPDLEPMRMSELCEAIERNLDSQTGIEIDVQSVDPGLWVQVDSYGLMLAVRYLVKRLTRECGARALTLKTTAQGAFVYLDIAWTGSGIAAATAIEWETKPLSAAGESSGSSLRELIVRNRAEIWHEAGRGAMQARFRIMLRGVEAEPATGPTASTSRPVYYDFDLFHQPGQNHALDQQSLGDLSYTAFDTETTGLEPSAGDEIISLGAVRIVNGRLLRGEVFDQLIDPGRPIDPKSIKIHGIRQSTLAGQPHIGAVLPAFHRFCEDTVLLAHNAAFDLRFLQIKEASTGISFGQPVLDTLLLSALLHDELEDHRLEAIAQRVGVDVIARHTALGDALLTAEVFLRMLPLLAARGIVTLRQALDASERTYYAKLRY